MSKPGKASPRNTKRITSTSKNVVVQTTKRPSKGRQVRPRRQLELPDGREFQAAGRTYRVCGPRIGKGSFVSVFKVQDVQTRQPFAARVSLTHASDNSKRGQDCRRVFDNESRVHDALDERFPDHSATKGICRRFATTDIDGYPCIITDFADGPGLDEYLRGGSKFEAYFSDTPQALVAKSRPLSRLGFSNDRAAVIAKIGVQIADALQDLGEAGLVFNDLKPSNVRLSSRWGVPRWSLIDSNLASSTDAPRLGTTPAYDRQEARIRDSTFPRELTQAGPDADAFAFSALLRVLFTGLDERAEERADATKRAGEQSGRDAASPSRSFYRNCSPTLREVLNQIDADCTPLSTATHERSLVHETRDRLITLLPDEESAYLAENDWWAACRLRPRKHDPADQYLLKFSSGRIVGRKDDIEKVLTWLENPQAAVARVLLAVGGVGKSAFIDELLHGLSRYRLRHMGFDDCLFVNCYANRELALPKLIRDLIATNNIFGDDSAIKQKVSDADLDAAIKVLGRQRHFIVIDGAERLLMGYKYAALSGLETTEPDADPEKATEADCRFIEHQDRRILHALITGKHRSRLYFTSRIPLVELTKLTDKGHRMVEESKLHPIDELACREFLCSIGIELSSPVMPTLVAICDKTRYHGLIMSVLGRSVRRDLGDTTRAPDVLASLRDLARDLKALPPAPPAAQHRCLVDNRAKVLGFVFSGLATDTNLDEPDPTNPFLVLLWIAASSTPLTIAELITHIVPDFQKKIDDERSVLLNTLDATLADLEEAGIVGRRQSLLDTHPIIRQFIIDCAFSPRAPDSDADDQSRVQDRLAATLKGVSIQHVKADRLSPEFALIAVRQALSRERADEAWELLGGKAWDYLRASGRRPVFRNGLLRCFEQLCGKGDDLRLPDLADMLKQTTCLSMYATVLAEAGNTADASTCQHWVAVLRMGLGDLVGYLDAVRSLVWSDLYMGKYADAETMLRRALEQSIANHLPTTITEEWLCLVRAIRGDEAVKTYAQSVRTKHNDARLTRYQLQTIAEALVYLGDTQSAERMLRLCVSGSSDTDPPVEGQLRWEQLTLAMAILDSTKSPTEALTPKRWQAAKNALERSTPMYGDSYLVIEALAAAYKCTLAFRNPNDRQRAATAAKACQAFLDDPGVNRCPLARCTVLLTLARCFDKGKWSNRP